VKDRLESEGLAALVVEDVDFEGSAVTRVKAVVNAMSELQRAGLSHDAHRRRHPGLTARVPDPDLGAGRASRPSRRRRGAPRGLGPLVGPRVPVLGARLVLGAARAGRGRSAGHQGPEIPQRLAAQWQQFFDAIVERRVTHSRDPVLARHAGNLPHSSPGRPGSVRIWTYGRTDIERETPQPVDIRVLGLGDAPSTESFAEAAGPATQFLRPTPSQPTRAPATNWRGLTAPSGQGTRR
jgi:hypothetical protein